MIRVLELYSDSYFIYLFIYISYFIYLFIFFINFFFFGGWGWGRSYFFLPCQGDSYWSNKIYFDAKITKSILNYHLLSKKLVMWLLLIKFLNLCAEIHLYQKSDIREHKSKHDAPQKGHGAVPFYNSTSTLEILKYSHVGNDKVSSFGFFLL